MPNSVNDPAVQAAIAAARTAQPAGSLTPSPADWRDVPIYFLMVDRFNNPNNPPKNMPFDASCNVFQYGSYQGIIDQLKILAQQDAPPGLTHVSMMDIPLTDSRPSGFVSHYNDGQGEVKVVFLALNMGQELQKAAAAASASP